MNRDFTRLWASVGVSAFGSALTEVALPVIALFAAHASAVELGALISIEQVAWLAFGLVAGVWVDRWSRRKVMVAADVGRSLLIVVIPIAAWQGALPLWLLFETGLLVGVCNVFAGVAHSALVPEVVERAGLVSANARINATDTASSLSGSALVGPVVAVLGAPVALVVDAVTYLASALLLCGIRVPPPQRPGRTHFRTELADGLRVVARDPLLRTLTLGSAAFNACAAAQYVLGFLFLRELHTPKALYGLLIAASGVGAFVGSVVLPQLTRRWPESTVWRTALVAGPLLGLLVPLAQPGPGLIVYAAGTFALSAAVAITSIIGFSARQAVSPPELLGRTSAISRVLTWGIIPIAATTGGWLADSLGVRGALWVVAGCYFAEPLIIRTTAVWHWATLTNTQEATTA